MAKRPYSKAFTPRGVPRRYLLAHIPPGLWERAQRQAKKQNLSMRSLLLHLLQTWVEMKEAG